MNIQESVNKHLFDRRKNLQELSADLLTRAGKAAMGKISKANAAMSYASAKGLGVGSAIAKKGMKDAGKGIRQFNKFSKAAISKAKNPYHGERMKRSMGMA